MLHAQLVQLPIPQSAALSSTGNVPLAAGSLVAALATHGLDQRVRAEAVAPHITDNLGDSLLADLIAAREPDVLGLSLYLWNTERSLHLARAVRARSPNTRVIVGGPEVGPDNPFVLAQEGFDIAVTGEAEDVFAELMQRLVDGRDVASLPGVAMRGPAGVSPFTPMSAVDFPLTKYGSPYLRGAVPVEASRSTYVETVRGCRSHCTFCFYPKSSNSLRSLSVGESHDLLRALIEKGARELVFLDPTFNHRPDFEGLLDVLMSLNPERAVRAFAEVRSEGLIPAHAKKLYAAGFDKLEIGLQSVNKETLKRVKRYGSPEKVAAAAKMLHDEGVRLLVDLIIGLPGDTADDVLRGIDFLHAHGLADEAQVFPLAILPGTAMRADAAREGLVFDSAPPYRIQRTATMDEDSLRDVLFEAEERLGRRLDEWCRPLLAEPEAGASVIDVFSVNADQADAGLLLRARAPGAQHVALWLFGEDLFARRDIVRVAVQGRLDVDPFATLDVVLAPTYPFPLDLLDLLEAMFARATPSYMSRAMSLRGEDAQHRISVVAPADPLWPADYLEALTERVQVFREQTATQAVRDASRLGEDLPRARIIDRAIDAQLFEELARQADPQAVVFAHRPLELRWLHEVVGYR